MLVAALQAPPIVLGLSPVCSPKISLAHSCACDNVLVFIHPTSEQRREPSRGLASSPPSTTVRLRQPTGWHRGSTCPIPVLGCALQCSDDDLSFPPLSCFFHTASPIQFHTTSFRPHPSPTLSFRLPLLLGHIRQGRSSWPTRCSPQCLPDASYMPPPISPCLPIPD